MRRPLEGLRVLDLGTRIAAPFCAGILDERTQVTQWVAPLGLLDLDDLGPLLAEDPRAERCRDTCAEIEDPESLQRASHHVSRCSANTSFIEPFCLRASSAPRAVAVLCIQWWAWKW